MRRLRHRLGHWLLHDAKPATVNLTIDGRQLVTTVRKVQRKPKAG